MVHPRDHILRCVAPAFVQKTQLIIVPLFSASRGFVIHVWGKDKVGPGEKVSASAIAGGVGGTAGGLLR
jgi:hypothetical protein